MNAKLPPQMIPACCTKCNAPLPSGEYNPEWVRFTRLNAGVSLRELARRIGISAPYLSDIEHGRRKCPERVAQAVSFGRSAR